MSVLESVGVGFTVTTAVANADPTVYVIVDVPPATPTTIPVADPTVATTGVPDVHVPPGVALLKVVDVPAHNTKVPVIGVTP